MKRAVWFAVVWLAMWAAAVAAQDKIYESTGKDGVPEFSGQPTPGATEVTLPPPNVIDTAAPQAQPAPQQEGPTGYAQLAILFPADQGTLHTNTGAFDLKVALQPALNAGDSFVVTLDGTPLAGRYTSGDIAVSEQDFQSAASDNVQHQLQVAVVDPWRQRAHCGRPGKLLCAPRNSAPAGPLDDARQGTLVTRGRARGRIPGRGPGRMPSWCAQAAASAAADRDFRFHASGHCALRDPARRAGRVLPGCRSARYAGSSTRASVLLFPARSDHDRSSHDRPAGVHGDAAWSTTSRPKARRAGSARSLI